VAATLWFHNLKDQSAPSRGDPIRNRIDLAGMQGRQPGRCDVTGPPAQASQDGPASRRPVRGGAGGQFCRIFDPFNTMSFDALQLTCPEA
jgi:hypothetical protein